MNKKVGVKIISSVLLGTLCFYTMPVFANTKEEVVYSKLKNDGTNYSTVVSERITNTDNSELINDISELLNIENTNGDETFEPNGTNVVWKANGKDIQYQGTIDKDEPITCKVKYELDGKEVEAKDIVGKSGNVKVTLTYTNNDAHTVKVNGKYEKMYTPFIVVAGTVIDNNFKNVNITNGKIIDNGNKKMAIAMCFPGLQESLGISKDKIDIPNTIELTMDAEDFEMNNIISYATPKVLEESDLNMFDDLDEIYSKVNELQDASNKIQDGANQLNDGAKELNNGVSQVASGVKLINSKVKASVSTMENDKTSALKKEQIVAIGEQASKQAVAGINSNKEIIKNTAAKGIDANKTQIENQMMSTAKQIAETTALKTAKQVAETTALATAKQVAEETALTTAETTALATTKDVYDELFKNNVIKEDVYKGLIDSINKPEIIEKIKENADKTIENQKSEIKENADKTIESQKSTIIDSNKKQEIIEKADKTIKSKEGEIIATADAGIEAQGDKIKQGSVESAKQIAETTAIATAQTVSQQVGKQVGQTVAEQVANQVKAGALKQVASSMKELTDGLDTLSNGVDQLYTGSSQLATGTSDLSNGINEFNKDGINKIVNAVNTDVKDIEDRVKALKDLANEYKSFAGINEKDEGTVSFITTIDSIKKEDFEKENAQATNGNTTNETVANETISNQDSKNETSNN